MSLVEPNGGIPETLSVVPLRSTIVFPMGATSIHLGMRPTLELLAAHAEDKFLVVTVVDRGDPAEEVDPTPWTGKIGVMAEIADRLNLPGGVVQATLQGLRRVRITGVERNGAYYTARVEAVEEVAADPVEAEIVIARAITILEALADVVERIPHEIPAVLRMNAADPGRFADLVATLTNFPPRLKDGVVQRLDVTERLQYVVEAIEEEYRRSQDALASNREGVAREAETDAEPGDDDASERTPEAGPETSRTPPLSRAEYVSALRRRLKQLQAQLGAIDPAEREAVELFRRIDTAGLPPAVAARARLEAERLRAVGTVAPQAAEIREYIDWLLFLPWTRRVTEAGDVDLERVSAALDRELLGLDEQKDRLLDLLAVARLKGDLSGPVPCLVGPPDVGKTALVRALAGGLGRPLHRIELRGRGEFALLGERRTHPDARPGRILQALRNEGARDIVILLEELDTLGVGKVQGDPAAAVEEILDWECRDRFVDRYLDIPFDLQDIIFVATAHDFFRIPHDVRERLVEIRLAGYTPEEKVAIAEAKLLPRMVGQHGLEDDDVGFDRDVLAFLARGYARDAGLEGLRRMLATLLRTRARAKAAGDRDAWSFDQDRIIDILGLPHYTATPAEKRPEVGVVTGLAWTAAGGEIMFIEALIMPGTGQLLTTGFLGDVMQESVVAAHSYVRSRSDELAIPAELFLATDIHVHFPVGAVPKDGPSAGVAVMLALASILSNRPVRHDVAVTGEVTLRGRVLEVGGIKEKVLAAYRAGIRDVVLPAGNERDLREVPDEMREAITFQFVERMDEVFAIALLEAETEDPFGLAGKGGES